MGTIDLKEIVDAISKLHEAAKVRSQTAGNIALIRANWKIGKRINDFLPGEGERNVYGDQVLEKLSKQLNGKFGRGFSRRSLNQMRRFNRLYTSGELRPKLTWTHYTFLIEIKSEKERKALEKRAIQEGLSSMALRSMVRTRSGREREAIRPGGKLYTYRTVERSNLYTERSETYLDLGFGMYSEELLSEIENAKELKHYPAFQLTNAESRKWKANSVGRSEQYLYLGYPERVVNGDTLQIKLDLGFKLLYRTRLRLSGVEAPEKGSDDESKIMRLMERKLKLCPVILVKTSRKERYGRWLARILYLEASKSPAKILKEGKLLNEEVRRAIRKLS